MRTLFLAICLSALPGLAADIYTFNVSPAENVSGPGGLFSLTGWGYTLQNQSSSDWLVTTSLDAGTFLYATPQVIFDHPHLAPGASVTVPYDPITPAGLYQILWDQDAPAGYVNSGTFTLSAQWWNGDPLAGGVFVSGAPSASAGYTATLTAPSVPEPGTFELTTVTLIGLLLAVVGIRRSRSRGQLADAVRIPG